MIVEINQTNINEALVEASFTKTIIFVPYDAQNPEHIAILNTFEQAIGPNNSFLTLAKADYKDEVVRSVCYQLQLQALPAAIVFNEGRPQNIVPAELLKTPNIVEIVKNLMPAPEQILLKEALDLAQAKEYPEAFSKISAAYELIPDDINVKFTYVDIAIKYKKISEARTVLDTVDPANQQTQTYKDLLSALTLAEQNQSNPQTDILKAKLQENPNDLNILKDLATALSQDGKNEEALELLLNVLRKDLNANDGNIKKIYLDIVATLNGDPIQPKYRRALYTLLY